MANRSTLSLLAALMAIALVQPVFSARVAPAGRSLLLATGNCPTKIAGCAMDRCGTKQVDGVSASVCERCRFGYIRANNGLQCICPPGSWQQGTGTGAACVPCDQAFYCPGGDRLARNSAPPQKIGVRIACDARVTDPAATKATVEALGMTTKSTRAKRYTDCVPIAGYYLTVATRSSQQAAKCGANTYSPGFSRLRACFKCQSGLVEPSYIASSPSALRTDKAQVCGVPKGRYLSQNVVRDCPAGTFRSTWELVTDVNARYCFPCPIGITTAGPASITFGACRVALPGYEINFALNVAAMEANMGTDANATVQDPALTPPPGPIGTYFPGGTITESTNATCKACPLGTTTQGTGSSAVEDCMVPPGYFIKTSTDASGNPTGNLTKCPTNATITVNGAAIRTGFYREGWKSQLDTSLQSASDGTDGACTPCGENILSLYTDIDELGTGDNTTNLVAASSASCYIEAGWGMTPVALEFNKWRANQCAANSYGVETRTFGLMQSPCKPCQRFMITLRSGANNYTECINPAGFGFTSDGVSQCPKGFYTAQASMAPCTACPSGRTTTFDPDHPELQHDITDCYVDAGNGIFSPGTVTNSSTDVNLPVLACPVGTYSNGGNISTTCTKCSDGYTTIDEGTVGSNNSACTVCSAGYGLPAPLDPTVAFASSGACQGCGFGTYQAGFTGVAGLNVVGDGKSCFPCAKTNFTYLGSSGKKLVYTSDGITFYTKSRGPEACVPRFSQLMIDAGQSYRLPTTGPWTSTTGTVQTCLQACKGVSDAGKACFAQADYTAAGETANCKTITLDLAPSTATTALLVKMMPSDPIAAASVKDDEASAKAMASGLYSRVAIPSGWTTTEIGQQLSTGTSEADCRQKCDQNSRCWGVLLDSGACTLRTGEDSLDTRSFFYNPDPSKVGATPAAFEALKW